MKFVAKAPPTSPMPNASRRLFPVPPPHPAPHTDPGPRQGFGTGPGLQRFRRDEDGSLVIFGLYMFILMLVIGGLAVDVMRHEALRTKLQSTTDRAVLAAASLEQTAVPEDVVDDYFAKAGLSDYLTSRDSESTLGFRHVTARTDAVQNNLFMNMLGIDTLNAAAGAAAEESITSIEVSLVLDVSNSMNSNNRIQNLRIAGHDFIDLLLGDTTDTDISISIVPYSGQVNVGNTLLSYYNASNEHSYSSCVTFDPDDFASTALDTTQPLKRVAHFDPWYASKSPQLRFCTTDPQQVITPLSNNGPALKTRMLNLTANGNTSIDVGMKWGAALLDPGTRPVIADLAANGHVPAQFSDRPYDFEEGQVLKAVVVMTDGENWDQFGIKPPYDTGLSQIWVNTSDNRPSIYHASEGEYYVEHLNEWRKAPWGATNVSCNWVYSGGWQQVCSFDAGTSKQLTYPEVWAMFTPRWVAKELYGDALGSTSYERSVIRNQWTNNFISLIAPATKNARLEQICDALKAEDVEIFAVGFEATATGTATMQNCASSPGHYYGANGLELQAAFAAIARQISQLKLIQ